MNYNETKVDVFGIRLNAIVSDQLEEELKKKLLSVGRGSIGKVNTEFLLRAKENKDFQETLNGLDINIADGKGVLWAAKYLSLSLTKIPILRQLQAIFKMIYSGASLVFYPRYCQYPISENIPGLDAMYLMLEAAKETGSGVYFFGAEKDVLSVAIEKMQEKYPNLKITGYHDGYDYKDAEIIQDINKSGAKLLIVALGSPKQEYWIRDNINKLETVRVAVGEGGTLDRVAGESKRAPKWMRKISIEWLWRLFTDKNRTGIPGKRDKSRIKRVWRAVPVFMYEVVKWKLKQ